MRPRLPTPYKPFLPRGSKPSLSLVRCQCWRGVECTSWVKSQKAVFKSWLWNWNGMSHCEWPHLFQSMGLELSWVFPRAGIGIIFFLFGHKNRPSQTRKRPNEKQEDKKRAISLAMIDWLDWSINIEKRSKLVQAFGLH